MLMKHGKAGKLQKERSVINSIYLKYNIVIYIWLKIALNNSVSDHNNIQ